jgi:hypothetical protein
MSSTYSFEELAAAAASSKSIGEVVRKLGREPTPKRNQYIRGLMQRHGIDGEHLRSRSRRYTRERLEEAAAASRSIAEVVRRLGAEEVGGTRAHIARRLRHYEIDISHFDSLAQRSRPARNRRPEDIPEAEFVAAIAQARSIAEVARNLNASDTASFRRRYRYIVTAQGLDVSHVLGQAHARGTRGRRRSDPGDVLVADPSSLRRIPAHRLRKALIEIGTPYRCALCGIGPVWRGREITLEVDHISGDFTDNRPENLRFLCPNCHATTPTFCRKKAS